MKRAELKKQRRFARKQTQEQPAQGVNPEAELLTADPEVAADYQREEQKINRFFRKEKKKNKPLKVSRSEEQERINRLSKRLNKAILAVSILLVMVFIAIFYF